MTTEPGSVAAHRNEVMLVGRLAASAQERELPSGDLVVTVRLVVDRPPRSRGRARAAVDALECCSAFRADVRRRALAWAAGDVVQVEGALRRRFWRSPTGPASRGEVEVEWARRVLAERATARSRPETTAVAAPSPAQGPDDARG
ncbi:single-stranded DNA-binding protein [Motilibacter aurantiacus]|uniref:single-stranded DNA-binding protein n=1 Tax=Motilibacter aurantiacus TaxID=2714955 RepID=UPI00140DE62B|nr:single-stranded DNA-binding protein [Motilibacter aurantiacus]NHC47084.1 single-stranded DNA-binding protein [Motilibacter aurantiacus]